MMAAPGSSWAPVYDPAETLAQFRERQRQAFAAFESAWREGRVAMRLKLFYDALVRRVGANQYAWMSEVTIAADFSVSVSSIKRWLRALERAELIRRQRRFATTSRTYLTAYDQPLVDVEEAPMESPGIMSSTDNQHAPPSLEQSRGYRQSNSSSLWPINDPTLGSLLPPDSIKRQHLSSVSGGPPQLKPLDPAVQTVLDREGVADFALAPRLQHLNWNELHAVQSYLNHQRNVRDRPRLFAWLATHRFGAQLLQGEQRRQRNRGAPPAASDHLRYVTGPLAPLIQGHAPDDASPGQQPAPMPLRALPGPPGAAPPPELWSAVLATLRETCPAPEWTTWLAPTALLELTDTTAVVGTPNVFVRDMVRDQYRALLEATVQACLGQVHSVEVVIGDL